MGLSCCEPMICYGLSQAQGLSCCESIICYGLSQAQGLSCCEPIICYGLSQAQGPVWSSNYLMYTFITHFDIKPHCNVCFYKPARSGSMS